MLTDHYSFAEKTEILLVKFLSASEGRNCYNITELDKFTRDFYAFVETDRVKAKKVIENSMVQSKYGNQKILQDLNLLTDEDNPTVGSPIPRKNR